MTPNSRCCPSSALTGRMKRPCVTRDKGTATRILSRSLTLSNKLHQTIHPSAQTPILMACTKQSQDKAVTLPFVGVINIQLHTDVPSSRAPNPTPLRYLCRHHSVCLMKSLPSVAATHPGQNTSDVILIT